MGHCMDGLPGMISYCFLGGVPDWAKFSEDCYGNGGAKPGAHLHNQEIGWSTEPITFLEFLSGRALSVSVR